MVGSLAIMAFAALECPEKTVWIGLDHYNKCGYLQQYLPKLDEAIFDGLKQLGKAHLRFDNTKITKKNYWSVSILRRVVRCSENIYWHAYQNIWHNNLKSTLGHKIPGIEAIDIKETWTISSHDHLIEEAGTKLCELFNLHLECILQQDMKIDDIAVILNGVTSAEISNYNPGNAHGSVGNTELIEYIKKHIRYNKNLPQNATEEEKLVPYEWNEVFIIGMASGHIRQSLFQTRLS